jgi:arylsulfatase
LVTLRFPKLFDIRADPFERADQDSGDYITWRVDRAYVLVPAQGFVGQHLQTYIAYPPRQKPGSFSLDEVLKKLQEAGGSGKH